MIKNYNNNNNNNNNNNLIIIIIIIIIIKGKIFEIKINTQIFYLKKQKIHNMRESKGVTEFEVAA